MTSVGLLFPTTITVLAPGAGSARSGAAFDDWDNPVTVGTTKSDIQGLTTTEETANERDGARSRWRVYLPSSAPAVDQKTRFTWGSRQLQVVGTPRPVNSQISGELHHWELDCKEVLG